MSRKRTPKNPTETSTVVAEQSATETSTAIAEPPLTDAPAGVAEEPAAEASADGQTFADRVGQKKWQAAPDPFGIAKDNLAGVRLFESKQDR